ncbi:MAG: peroxiredoxin family protein [Candidatus Methylomirabilales bacterium]
MTHFRNGPQMSMILLSCLAVGGLVWGGVPVGVAQVAPAHTRMVNRPAPEFSLTLLSGKKVKLKDYRGKVLVLNFWNSR